MISAVLGLSALGAALAVERSASSQKTATMFALGQWVDLIEQGHTKRLAIYISEKIIRTYEEMPKFKGSTENTLLSLDSVFLLHRERWDEDTVRTEISFRAGPYFLSLIEMDRGDDGGTVWLQANVFSESMRRPNERDVEHRPYHTASNPFSSTEIVGHSGRSFAKKIFPYLDCLVQEHQRRLSLEELVQRYEASGKYLNLGEVMGWSMDFIHQFQAHLDRAGVPR